MRSSFSSSPVHRGQSGGRGSSLAGSGPQHRGQIETTTSTGAPEGGAVPAATQAASSRAELAIRNALLPTYFDGNVWRFESADLSAQVSADSAQGVYVAAASDASGVSGAWVRQFDGPLVLQWFGVNNAGFAALLSLADYLGLPASAVGSDCLLTEQHSLPAGITLTIDGGELYVDDNTIESTLLVENDNVSLFCRNGGQVRGALTNAAGMTGVCVLARGSSGFRCSGLVTQDGKYGLITLENDDMRVEDAVVNNSSRWGIVSAGNRDFTFENARVETTRDVSASDCWKIFGAGNGGWSTRSSYGGRFINCTGNGAAAGQSFDIIADNDAADDLYNLVFVNPLGRMCSTGFFEMKVTEDIVTHYPMHSITVTGGAYYGSGSEIFGVQVADRIFNIEFKGTKVHDTEIGFNTSAACRQVRLVDIVAVRPRTIGVKWLATGGIVGNQLIRPTVIDPNYGQGASTYPGISIQAGTELLLESPTVIRSQVPSGSAHNYGIEILAAVSRLNITGNVTLSGHATAAFNNAGTDVFWPTTVTSHEINLAFGSGGDNFTFGSHRERFQACAISVVYTEASNIGRNITIQGRDTANGTNIYTYATDAAAAENAFAEAQLTTPVQLSQSRPAFVASIAADPDYPGSPTGKVIISVHGFRDAAALS